MIGLVDYISRNPYQPAKTNSKYDEEFLVATLSPMHTDAKLLQQEKQISVVTLNQFYHDSKPDFQTSSTQYTKQILNINSVRPKLIIKDNMSLAPQSSSSVLKRNHKFISDSATRIRLTKNNPALAMRMHHSNLLPFKIINLDSEHAMRVRLTQNNSTFAKQKPNQNSTNFNCTKFDSTPAPQVHLTQNQFTLTQQFHIFNSIISNHNIFVGDFDPPLRFTHNKLTLAGHNPLFFIQSFISYNSNALFATHTSKHQIKSKLASHKTNTIKTSLQIVCQIALFETQNT